MPAKPQTVMIDGSNPHDGQTVTTDHYVTEFRVSIRSMNRLTLTRLRDLIQTQYEVTDIDTTKETCYCRS